MQQYFPVICGEWCLFNSLAVGHDTKGGQSVLNGVDGMNEECVSPEKRKKSTAHLHRPSWTHGMPVAGIFTGATSC